MRVDSAVMTPVNQSENALSCSGLRVINGGDQHPVLVPMISVR